jgi:hypothetical protein
LNSNIENIYEAEHSIFSMISFACIVLCSFVRIWGSVCHGGVSIAKKIRWLIMLKVEKASVADQRTGQRLDGFKPSNAK